MTAQQINNQTIIYRIGKNSELEEIVTNQSLQSN